MKTTTIPGTPTAEADVLAATAAAIAAGQDPFGDDGEDDTDTAAAAGADDDAGDEAKDGDKGGDTEAKAAGDEVDTTNGADDEDEGEEGALSAEALAAIAAGDEPAQAAAPSKRYDAGNPAEFKEKRQEHIATKAKALKDLMDGVIEPEEYSRIEAEVTDALDALTVQRTLHEANVQTEQQTQESVIDGIIAAAKKSGEVDYRADAKAAKQFDTALAMLAGDGETRTYAELAADAHRAVLAIRGITKAAPTAEEAAAAADKAAKPRENGKGPVTLRNVPAAETPNSGSSWKEVIGALSGQAYEEAYSKLSKAQQAELLND